MRTKESNWIDAFSSFDHPFKPSIVIYSCDFLCYRFTFVQLSLYEQRKSRLFSSVFGSIHLRPSTIKLTTFFSLRTQKFRYSSCFLDFRLQAQSIARWKYTAQLLAFTVKSSLALQAPHRTTQTQASSIYIKYTRQFFILLFAIFSCSRTF